MAETIVPRHNMLSLQFQHFRCWENLSIEAPLGGITLIKGSSGSGKTTILQGITWGLYGNIRLVAPNHNDKAKTRVRLELPVPIIIDRQKNPNRLLVTYNNQIYEDKVAQSIIDDIFGSYDIWLASCYIGQGCRNTFLTAPNTGKMELLNSIAFHEEDPTSYIEKIDAVITSTDTDYKQKLSLFTNNLTAFQAEAAIIDITKALPPERCNSIKDSIAILTDEITNLQQLKHTRDINIGILSNQETQLQQVQNTNIHVQEPDANLVDLYTKYEGTSVIADIESAITRIRNVLPLLQRRNDLNLEVAKMANLLLPYIHLTDKTPYTIEDYQQAVSAETIYRDSQRLATNLGVLYNQSAITETISRHQNTLNSQDRLKKETERNNIQTRLNTLEHENAQVLSPLISPEIIPKEIVEPDYEQFKTEALSLQLNELSKQHGAIQAHIEHLRKGQDVLQCPECKIPIRCQNGVLVLADTGPTEQTQIREAQTQLLQINSDTTKITQEIHALNMAENAARNMHQQNLIAEQRRVDSLKQQAQYIALEQQKRDIAFQNRIQQIKDLTLQLQVLQETIDTLPEPTGDRRILTYQEIEQTHILIGKLSSITIVNAPTLSSQHIQMCLNYQDLAQKNTIAISAYNEYCETIAPLFRNESIVNLQNYITKLQTYRDQTRFAADEKLRLERLKASLEAQIQETRAKIIPDPTHLILEKSNQITSYQQELFLSQQAHQFIQKHNIITQEREVVVTLNTQMADLQVLRQHAVDTECRILQQVVDSINASIDGVCSTLFDRDISITLSLYKTLKTTKNVKPVVNFSIAYQGGTFDNINQMSGGEGDRSSLALTLALNRLSSCPLLMLDESLASLDLNMKDAAIRTIRENTTNTVLIVMHDGIEGIYDHIIDVDVLRELHD